MSERFNVVIFYDDGFHEYVRRDLPAREAVEVAKICTEHRAAARVVITDSGDFTNFLWQRGKGIVFPKREEVP